MSKDEYLDAADIAKQYQVTRGAVYAWVNRNATDNPLPAVRLGRSIRIKVADFDAWLRREQTNQANDSATKPG